MRAALDGALARHRAISVAALALLTLMAWAWLLTGANTGMAPSFSLVPAHAGTPMAAMPGMDMAMPAASSPALIALTFWMWWVMMVAMMLPSAAPTILLYSLVATTAQAKPAAGSFLAGYLLAWGAFSAAATTLQLAAQHSGLVAPDIMASQSKPLTGAILIAVGIYQLSPLKNACLRHCRTPAHFLARHFRPGPTGALRMGALHGAICVACCWLLMALLLVGGVMNLAWIALITLMIAAEKLLPFGRAFAVLSGAACLAWGAWMLLA